MRHTFAVLVSNQPGVLARVAGLFSARGFNVASLTVGETDDSQVSRITLVVDGDDAILEQVRKQLGKLIDTLKVQDLTGTPFVARELMLVKIHAQSEKFAEIAALAQISGAKILYLSPRRAILEITGDATELDRFIDLARPYGLVELLRAGQVAMTLE